MVACSLSVSVLWFTIGDWRAVLLVVGLLFCVCVLFVRWFNCWYCVRVRGSGWWWYCGCLRQLVVCLVWWFVLVVWLAAAVCLFLRLVCYVDCILIVLICLIFICR